MRRISLFLVAILLASFVSVLSIQSAASETVSIAITNVRDTSFTISWLTPTDETGQVQLIDGGIYEDDRGAHFLGTTHYVTLTSLKANANYSFDVISNGTRYDNAGAHWTMNIGAMLLPRPTDLIFGQVRNSDGSNVTDAIVFSTIDRVQQGFPSAALSVLVTADDDGFFSIDLGQARTLSDPTSYFEYAIRGDRYMNNCVTLFAVSARGAGLVTVDMEDARLRTNDPRQMLVITLTATPLPTPTVPPGVTPPSPTDTRTSSLTLSTMRFYKNASGRSAFR